MGDQTEQTSAFMDYARQGAFIRTLAALACGLSGDGPDETLGHVALVAGGHLHEFATHEFLYQVPTAEGRRIISWGWDGEVCLNHWGAYGGDGDDIHASRERWAQLGDERAALASVVIDYRRHRWELRRRAGTPIDPPIEPPEEAT